MSAKAPQTISIRVRYAETDKMGVVYHANYFMWFEIGRCELLRAVGRSYRDMEASGIGLPVIEAHCEYKSPARYDDELVVKTKPCRLPDYIRELLE
jgi:acyl-CoA thioester hydrolase